MEIAMPHSCCLVYKQLLLEAAVRGRVSEGAGAS